MAEYEAQSIDHIWETREEWVTIPKTQLVDAARRTFADALMAARKNIEAKR